MKPSTTNRVLAYLAWSMMLAGAFLIGGTGGVLLAIGIPLMIICLFNEAMTAALSSHNREGGT